MKALWPYELLLILISLLFWGFHKGSGGGARYFDWEGVSSAGEVDWILLRRWRGAALSVRCRVTDVFVCGQAR